LSAFEAPVKIVLEIMTAPIICVEQDLLRDSLLGPAIGGHFFLSSFHFDDTLGQSTIFRQEEVPPQSKAPKSCKMGI
jgi:hypothetical protein